MNTGDKVSWRIGNEKRRGTVIMRLHMNAIYIIRRDDTGERVVIGATALTKESDNEHN